MVNDKLAEFNGIKPNLTLEEGDEKIGTPVNARSCKHLISLLGEQYEEARLEYMNPGGPPLKGLPNHSNQKSPSNPSPDSSGSHNKGHGATSTSKSTKPTSVLSSKPNAKPSSSNLLKTTKAKVQAKEREKTVQKKNDKKNDDDDDSMDVDDDENNMDNISDVDMNEDENDDVKPTKQSVVPSKRPVKRAKEDPEIEGEEEEVENNPNKRLKQRSSSDKGKSPVKKPNKGNQAISETEDDSELDPEDNNNKSTLVKGKGKKISDQKPAPSKAKAPAKATSKPSSRKRTRKDESETDDDDANDSDNQADRKPPSTSKKLAIKSKPASKRQKFEEEEGDEPEDNDEGDDEEEEDDDDDDEGRDELASIKGIKPNVLMEDGEEMEVQSQTSSSTYKVKRTWDHYYCCKHLISLLGEKYEAARIKLKNPDGAALRPPNSKKKSSKKGKNTGDDDDNGGSSKTDVAVLLANSWDVDKGPDPTGWWVSEKLDGVRTFYDGKRMYSRLGNPFTPPQWFLDKLPKDVTLDGELFGGRGEFQNTVSIVKTMNSPHWKGITFHIFDIPSLSTQPFEARLEHLKKLFAPGTGSYASDKVIIVEQQKAKSRKHVLDKLKEIESLGGEGLMLRKPGSLYEGKRSSTLLKIKSFYDAEAVVTGYKPGKGRNAGVTGALKCKMASGKTFDVGSGLNDKQRKTPPKIGSIIVYRFQELTKDGVPRFPTYLGEAADKTKPKDAVVPDHRKAGAKKSDVPSE
ncbi:DNA ligase [Lentinula lateritia]|uniref:DNA ligase n=1 Tax=Lentinula aff. lateritia TaxID=2804960 RepID=A0ACC1TUT9_9AGAR|nr:DNA ligase [Lentinula aff. lateritia]KAJ3850168.1 DNA ligase [Lentinula lateritia]